MDEGLPAGRERTVQLRGSPVHFWEGGGGEPLVFLHGAGSVGQQWVASFPRLARQHRVLVPDLPGFGLSPELPGVGTFSVLAEALAELLPGIAEGPVDLMGNSMGGGLAAGIALRHPELVHRLVLVAPGGLVEHEDRAREASHVRPGEVNRALFHRPERGQKDFVRLTPEELRRRWASSRKVLDQWVRAGLEPVDFPSIRAPTLVVWGREDQILPSAWAVEIADRIPGARAVVLEDCGHVPHLELPDEFCRVVDGFLRPHAPAPPPVSRAP